jgi:agmatinase
MSRDPRLALIGFRSDENSSFRRGAAAAPPLIRSALTIASSNEWSENGYAITPSRFFDAGDFGPQEGADLWGRIESSVGALLDQGLLPIVLGGDHAITHPVLRAFARKYPRLELLHFDAHPDLYDDFDGNPRSHASPFARIMEQGLVARLVQVGIRTMNAHCRAQAERFGVEVIEMRDFREDRIPSFAGPVYVSFDMDGLDPACAPGVSHREPGGLTTRQAVDVIQGIRAPIVGADVVEFNPGMDSSGMTAMVCAKLVKELAGQMLELAGEPRP